ncbi:MAG: DNA polymerase elongation subunit, family B [Candidatus Nanosalina sp. J07AB43]|nr:MAG: DNA polymerase elongation subunit, family B [Candidatus Nanosalina sp. J07AB43]
MLTVDIEVWSGGSFPDTEKAEKPVTAITAHDSYTDEYFSGVLHPDSVPEGGDHSWDNIEFTSVQESVSIYHDETKLLGDFFDFVDEKNPDMLTGWNSSSNGMGQGFDYPYLVNRAERINQWDFEKLAPEDEEVFVTRNGRCTANGRVMFDMLQAYKKTQIHKKRSYSLGYIAQDELGYGKEDIEDLDEGWLHNPVEFMKYNIRDVEAVHEIEQAKSVVEIYDHIRSITGTTYSEIANSNIDIIDMLFLRRAKENGYGMPTSERPDVEHYWGAYVFDPHGGKHENVVYPDLSSLYPNLFRDMNASPETIVGTEADLRASQYTEDDCFELYVDPRSEQTKKDADEPERRPMYVLKPEVQESFVREIVGELIDMKYEYKSDEYASEAYGAVKRIVNSVYGVMGDSVSYGKGFRLFDWRIAEAITLAGRDVIKHTADTFESRVQSMGYSDAQIIAGDTDSCVCTLPNADGSYTHSQFSQSEAKSRIEESEILNSDEAAVDTPMHETLLAAIDAAEYVDMTYDEFMTDRFGIENDHMAVEIESYAESALFMNKKKRYAQRIRWDEGDYVDESEYKGFELVRSDSARITGEVQTGVIDRILTNDSPKDVAGEYLSDEWHSVLDGDTDLDRLGKPSAINNDLFDYGWSIDDDTDKVKYFTPQPHIRGARYAKHNIAGEDPSEGSKPLMFYTNGVAPTSDLPETYSYDDVYSLTAPKNKEDANRREMKEIDREVDAVSVTDVRNMPEAVRIDFEKMANKTIRDPIEPVVQVMGWSFDNLVEEGEQTGLASFM